MYEPTRHLRDKAARLHLDKTTRLHFRSSFRLGGGEVAHLRGGLDEEDRVGRGGEVARRKADNNG
jgi:hypothetical protein